MKKIALFILALTYLGCQSNPITLDDRDRSTMVIDGQTRSFFVRLPGDYSETQEYALLLYLHGGGQSAVDVMNLGFTEAGHVLNYIVVYPSGIGGNWFIYDNTGQGSSDVKYLSTLIDRLIESYAINSDQVFVSGFSLGGFMSYSLAFAIPEKLRAISVHSGSVFPEHMPEELIPLSVQHIHALDDGGIPFEDSQGQVMPVREVIQNWVEANGATESLHQIKAEREYQRWESKDRENTLELVIFEKGGHQPFTATPELLFAFFDGLR
ncbi:MAG: alpha/beta hydrolase-fold protein [Spirochaetales bacterium]|nr:alpha/beta hydrolase-fold protein [Spirochaetales bacterium]